MFFFLHVHARRTLHSGNSLFKSSREPVENDYVLVCYFLYLFTIIKKEQPKNTTYT